MEAADANLEPIFLVYEGGGDAGRIVDDAAAAPPLLELRRRRRPDATGSGRSPTPRLHDRIAADLRDRRALIADGHHRYATYRALQARRHAAGDGPGPGTRGWRCWSTRPGTRRTWAPSTGCSPACRPARPPRAPAPSSG